MNEPRKLIRRKGKFGVLMSEVDPLSMSNVDEFAGSVPEGMNSIQHIQYLIETITSYILSQSYEDYEDEEWNCMVSRVSNWIYLRAVWIRSHVPLSMITPYIYRQDLVCIETEDFGFTGEIVNIRTLMDDVIGRYPQNHLLVWDKRDKHVIHIMRAITERLNFDRLLCLRDGEQNTKDEK